RSDPTPAPPDAPSGARPAVRRVRGVPLHFPPAEPLRTVPFPGDTPGPPGHSSTAARLPRKGQNYYRSTGHGPNPPPCTAARHRKTRSFKVASDESFGILTTLDEAGHGDRMRRDLNQLPNRYPQSGWSQAIARIDGPAVEETPEVEATQAESDEDAA